MEWNEIDKRNKETGTTINDDVDSVRTQNSGCLCLYIMYMHTNIILFQIPLIIPFVCLFVWRGEGIPPFFLVFTKAFKILLLLLCLKYIYNICVNLKRRHTSWSLSLSDSSSSAFTSSYLTNDDVKNKKKTIFEYSKSIKN